jgi:hypothetical protein
MNKMKNWVIYALIASAFGGLVGCQGSDKTPPSPLEIRGQALRKDIDKAYRKLSASGVSLQGANISETFVLHIPPGTSFEEAEAILKGAGFEISPPPTEQDQPKYINHGYAIHASINPYVQHLISRDLLFVQLISEKKYEFRTVQRIRAVFSELSL